MQVNEKTKKVLNTSMRVAAWLVVVFTVFIMIFTVISVTTVGRNDRSLFGVRFYIVKTDSMSKSENNKDMDIHFKAGDIVLIKKIKNPAKTLEAGDVIAFVSANGDSYGETITHMIREVRTDKDGKVLGYVTFGTNTGTNDEALVEPEYVLGKYVGKLPGLGNFFAFVKSTKGYIVCILVPFVLLILYNGVNVIRLFRKYRAEQSAMLDTERAEIAAERKQTEDLLLQLQALKEQLEKNQNGAASPAQSAEGAEVAQAPAEEPAKQEGNTNSES